MTQLKSYFNGSKSSIIAAQIISKNYHFADNFACIYDIVQILRKKKTRRQIKKIIYFNTCTEITGVALQYN